MSELFRAFAEHSRFVQRVRRRHAAELSLLPPGLPDRAVIADLIARLQPQRTLAAEDRQHVSHAAQERSVTLVAADGTCRPGCTV